MKSNHTPETARAIVREIKEVLLSIFGDRPYFACIYGSFARQAVQEGSDLDMFVATPSPKPEDYTSLTRFILELHERHDLGIDCEVPFSNKLLVSYTDLRDAIELAPFRKDSGVRIPAIEKNEAFLASRDVRLRLLLNALTTPHLFLGEDIEAYEGYRKQAEKAVYDLAGGLLQEHAPSPNDALAILLSSPHGETGELYLGYKRVPAIEKHLAEILEREYDLMKRRDAGSSPLV